MKVAQAGAANCLAVCGTHHRCQGNKFQHHECCCASPPRHSSCSTKKKKNNREEKKKTGANNRPGADRSARGILCSGKAIAYPAQQRPPTLLQLVHARSGRARPIIRKPAAAAASRCAAYSKASRDEQAGVSPNWDTKWPMIVVTARWGSSRADRARFSAHRSAAALPVAPLLPLRCHV